jgi:hypothetical protein
MNTLKNECGGALVAALILVVISGIMGATILFATSTDIQISGNYRRTLQSFYAAEAGLAESQRRLIGAPTTHTWFAGDPAPAPQTNWSAYVLTRTGWTPQEDPSYSTVFANFVPVKGNTTNTIIVPNSVQSTLSYWSKIRHKTEFDAEQSGHSVVTPHYLDGDGSIKTHSQANRGNLILYGYPENFPDHPRQFSAAMPAMYPPVEVIFSQGEVEGAMSIIQAEVAHHPGPPIGGAVNIGRQAVLAGREIAISGMDGCGLLSNGRPPISLGPDATVFGTATFFWKSFIPGGRIISAECTSTDYRSGIRGSAYFRRWGRACVWVVCRSDCAVCRTGERSFVPLWGLRVWRVVGRWITSDRTPVSMGWLSVGFQRDRN